jgi:hypothetical protein
MLRYRLLIHNNNGEIYALKYYISFYKFILFQLVKNEGYGKCLLYHTLHQGFMAQKCITYGGTVFKCDLVIVLTIK